MFNVLYDIFHLWKVWTCFWWKLLPPRWSWTGLEEIFICGEALCWYYRRPIWLSFLLLEENDSAHLCGNAQISRPFAFTCIFPQSSSWGYQVKHSVGVKIRFSMIDNEMLVLETCFAVCRFAFETFLVNLIALIWCVFEVYGKVVDTILEAISVWLGEHNISVTS